MRTAGASSNTAAAERAFSGAVCDVLSNGGKVAEKEKTRRVGAGRAGKSQRQKIAFNAMNARN